MRDLVYTIHEIGTSSIDIFWFPVLIWTLCCTIAFLLLKANGKLNPLFHYHLRTAALFSLPLGIGASVILNKIPDWFASSQIETAFFIVQSPIEIVAKPNSTTSEHFINNWNEPSLFIGLVTIIVAIISFIMLVRLFQNYLSLKKLNKNLTLAELSDFDLQKKSPVDPDIKIAFHNHPLVPFTFGWKEPVIVLPEILKNDPEKLNMALQHELIHIKRGDYLLQLALALIESLFWFHPLIHYGNKEIDTYREISCDQEVLSRSDFSIKSYANLLFELVPISSGAERLSVSMAVKNSTLKKRIKTMKYHKLHKASFRQSIIFLMLMMIGITLPIACSDLRGPEIASNEELELSEIRIQNPALSVNGIDIKIEDTGNIKAGGLGAIQIITQDYGMFKVAPRNFDGGIQAGSIDGNKLTFELNELNIELNSSGEIIPGISRTPVWVSYYKGESFSNMIFPMENALAQMPPPPPSPSSQSEEGDFFVVVEKMPQLIGGMKALQAKVEYPEMARRAGIEGRVVVQFIVNENGDVENAKVVKGIGGGADEEALRVAHQAKFEPGIQRGQAVKVQYALSVNFTLDNADFSTSSDFELDPKQMVINIQKNKNSVTGIVEDMEGNPLSGVNIVVNETNKGVSTGSNGEFTIENIDEKNITLTYSYVGYSNKTVNYKF